MKTNVKKAPIRTHEGGRAKHINPEQQLRRSVMACMLWESTFYESGEDIAERVANTIPKVKPDTVAAMAIEAREKMKLRHMPLFMVSVMAKLPTHRDKVRETLGKVIQRADELAEFLALLPLDRNKGHKMTHAVRKGVADAFKKFNEYALAKYNREGTVKLKDALFLSHAKPKDKEQENLWKRLIDDELAIPDTWENLLSKATTPEEKKAVWEKLLSENKLGALALLRNLRNMQSVGIEKGQIREALANMSGYRVLPFRFIAAARYAPDLEPELEQAMFKCLTEKPKLSGSTILMVDVSGSMDAPISNRSDLMRMDAACGLAMLLREVCSDVRVTTFSNDLKNVPARRGFALRDAIVESQPHGGTYLGSAVTRILPSPSDRIIVISDEQAHDNVPDANRKAYMINVASYKNGVGYGAWTHIDGWSEACVDYIAALEAEEESHF